MSSSFICHPFHIVFSTKNREPFIAPVWRPKLHAYFRGLIEGLGGDCEIVGGTADHIHLLMRLYAMHRPADFMREVKKASSAWAKKETGLRHFGWQDGYASFAVSASLVNQVRRYIENQEQHHQKRGFREELIILLRRSGMDFDERYLD
jgi:putative transposase